MSNKDIDDIYEKLLISICENGEVQNNERGANKAVIGYHIKVDAKKIPIITRRRMRYKQSVIELLWWLKGEDHIEYLQEHGCRYWDKDAGSDGIVGLNYGLMTNWPCNPDHKSHTINQLSNCIEKLKNPTTANSRNLNVTMVKPDEETKVQACIIGYTFNLKQNKYLCMNLTQRSCDVSCRFPADIFTFALLLHLVCNEVNISRRKKKQQLMQPDTIYHAIHNAHIYMNNMEHTRELLSREKIPVNLKFEFAAGKSMWDLEPSDIKLIGYDEVKQKQSKISAKLNLNARSRNEE